MYSSFSDFQTPTDRIGVRFTEITHSNSPLARDTPMDEVIQKELGSQFCRIIYKKILNVNPEHANSLSAQYTV